MLPTRGKRFLLYAFQLSQIAQHRTDIGIEQNGLNFKPFHSDGLALVDAGVGSPGILRRHAQERHFDDAGGIAADAQFQKQDTPVLVLVQKTLIPPGRGIPAPVSYTHLTLPTILLV